MRGNSICDIHLSDIVVNPHQPRRIFNEQSLQDLAESIASHGLIQPIIVRQIEENKYEIVAGERRFRAYQLLGEDIIPAIVKDISSQDSSVLALIENIQRDDLHYFEEAKSYEGLLHSYHWTQEELSLMIGRSQSTIANKLRLLNLSSMIQDKLIEYKLSERHARSLLSLKEEKQTLLALEHINKHGMSVKQTELYIEGLLAPSKRVKRNISKPIVKNFIKDIRLFTNTIKQAVDSVNSAGLNATYNVREAEDHYTITIDIPIDKNV